MVGSPGSASGEFHDSLELGRQNSFAKIEAQTIAYQRLIVGLPTVDGGSTTNGANSPPVKPLNWLKNEKLIQVDGGDLVGEVSYKFSLTDLGRKRAQEATELCAYVGPAPVPLEDYVEQCYRQTVTGLQCFPEVLRAPFSHLVLKEDMFNNIGPAIISGGSASAAR